MRLTKKPIISAAIKISFLNYSDNFISPSLIHPVRLKTKDTMRATKAGIMKLTAMSPSQSKAVTALSFFQDDSGNTYSEGAASVSDPLIPLRI